MSSSYLNRIENRPDHGLRWRLLIPQNFVYNLIDNIVCLVCRSRREVRPVPHGSVIGLVLFVSQLIPWLISLYYCFYWLAFFLVWSGERACRIRERATHVWGSPLYNFIRRIPFLKIMTISSIGLIVGSSRLCVLTTSTRKRVKSDTFFVWKGQSVGHGSMHAIHQTTSYLCRL